MNVEDSYLERLKTTYSRNLARMEHVCPAGVCRYGSWKGYVMLIGFEMSYEV